jgi:hypothetical protein
MEMRNSEFIALLNCHERVEIVTNSYVFDFHDCRVEDMFVVRTISARSIFSNRQRSEFSALEHIPQNLYLN